MISTVPRRDAKPTAFCGPFDVQPDFERSLVRTVDAVCHTLRVDVRAGASQPADHRRKQRAVYDPLASTSHMGEHGASPLTLARRPA
jgi:hypothetical protein